MAHHRKRHPQQRFVIDQQHAGDPDAGLPGPFEEMEDGFNSGWIDFAVAGTEPVAGKVTPAPGLRAGGLVYRGWTLEPA